MTKLLPFLKYVDGKTLNELETQLGVPESPTATKPKLNSEEEPNPLSKSEQKKKTADNNVIKIIKKEW
jgi:hypothetical protein